MIFQKTRFQSQLLAGIVIIQSLASAFLLKRAHPDKVILGSGYTSLTWLFAVIILCLILAVAQLYRLLKTADLETEYELANLKLEGSKEQLDCLLAQRHDFLNHLQTIIGFLQLNRPEMVQKYTQEVINDLMAGQTTASTNRIELEAILIKMVDYGEERGVSVKYQIQDKLEPAIPIPPTSTTRLVTNLLRNAIEAVEHLAPDSRWVKLSLDKQDNQCRLVVHNPGPYISKPNLEKIFDTGFSTKAKTGRGLGLGIVKTLTQERGGTISVESSQALGIKFTIMLPLN